MVIPSEYVSSICEIKTMNNNLVATGMVTEITEEYIEISIKSGVMTKIRYGSEVKINVFNSRLGFRVLVGSVYTSSRDFVTIMDIASILDYERRHFFRVDIDLKAEICILKQPEEPRKKLPGLDDEPQPSDTVNARYLGRRNLAEELAGMNPLLYQDDIPSPPEKRRPDPPRIKGSQKLPLKPDRFGRDPLDFYDLVPVHVKNLSLSGLMIVSDKVFEGETLLVLLQIEQFRGILECIIKRVKEGPGVLIEYGCEFVDLPDDVSNSLCRYVFQKQREQINKPKTGSAIIK